MKRSYFIIFWLLMLPAVFEAQAYEKRFKVYAKDVHTLLFYAYANQTKDGQKLLDRIAVKRSLADKKLLVEKFSLLEKSYNAANVQDFAEAVIRIYQLPTAPVGRPDFELGRKTYETNCASCHGTQGDGKGPLATKLNPPPTAFTDPEASVFRCYNRNFVGDKRSGKADIYDVVGEQNLWSACFYAMTLVSKGTSTGTVSAPKLTIQQLSTANAEQYENWSKEFKLTPSELRKLPFQNQLPRR